MKRTVVTLLLAGLLAAPGVARAQTQVVEFYHLDAGGNVLAVTDSNGVLVESHDYLPFGEECTTANCLSTPADSSIQALRFSSKERDAETQLDYFGARYYDADRGRFTTVDPVYTWQENLQDPQRWNRYAYGRNNPLRYKDPDGRVLDTVLDIGFIAYDLFDIGRSIYRGEGVSGTQVLSLAGDVAGAAVPFATGFGAAARSANKVDDVVDAARGTSNIIDAGKVKGVAKEGRYEFPDQAADGVAYVGQSGNIPKRLRDHERSGRLTRGTESTTEVFGGKTSREVAEHKRIQEITDGVPASQSDRVSNKVDPIGPNRRHLLDGSQ